jgi:hypothetical protein
VRSSGDSLGRNTKLALQFVGKLRELVRPAGYENNVVMIFGKELNQFVSDATRCAGDESGLIHSGWLPRAWAAKKADSIRLWEGPDFSRAAKPLKIWRRFSA